MTLKRRYYRLKTTLSLELRPISDEEFSYLSRTIRDALPDYDAGVEEQFGSDKTRYDKVPENIEVYRYLQLLDSKLNTILDLLCESKNQEARQSKEMEVEISGSGIKLTSAAPLEKGEYLELKILLPVATALRIVVLCQVVRCTALKAEDRPGFEVALDFVAISEFNRDLIIRYMFMKERENLRLHRGSM